jgi:hypothetical protein
MKTLCALLLMSLFVLPAAARYSGGSGTAQDPYQIATAADLILLGGSPADYGKHFLLTADIDLDPNLGGRKVFNRAVIAPTWYGVTPFAGVLDGNGHTISHLIIEGAGSLGLFGHLAAGATVKNLGVVDVNVTGWDFCVGALVGSNEGGSVTHCHSAGAVSGHSYVGGLVGGNGGDLIACEATGSVRGRSFDVGGLVGYNSEEGSLRACHAASVVDGSAGDVGGLVGHNEGGTLNDCYATGWVSGESDLCGSVGGLVGDNWGGAITGCWAGGSVLGGGRDTGGLVGLSNGSNTFGVVGRNGPGKIRDCFATGAVAGVNACVGGLVGTNYSCDLISCYATGLVGGTSYRVGGLVGENYRSSIIDCNATGSVLGEWVVGGLVGFNSESTLTSCFATGAVAGADLSLGSVGGLIGENSGGTLRGCYATGMVEGVGRGVGGLVGSNGGGSLIACEAGGSVSGGEDVGGLLGSNGGVLADCRSTGLVRGTSDRVGGLIGWNQGNVTACYNTGGVSGGGQSIGGLVGDNAATILNCYNTGSVRGTEGTGGLVGYGGGWILNSYSTGMVSGTKHVGGLVGYGVGSVATGCFWDTRTSGQTVSDGGTGMDTARMQDLQIYRDAGWDFIGAIDDGASEVWQMPPGGGYPFLAIFNGYTPPRLPGQGTPEDPYMISGVMELGAVVHYDLYAHFRLATAIDLSGIRWSTAVIPWLFGTFDGNDLEISHLTIHGYGGGHVGLFGQLASGAAVKNLGLVTVNITDLGSAVGGLAGANSGALAKDYCTGTVSGEDGVGGLVGHNSGAVTQCFSSGVIIGTDSVGGLVGHNEEDVTDCYSTGEVKGSLEVGGLLGRNVGHVIRCFSAGAVSGTESVGGLVGCFWPDDVTASFWDIQTSGQMTSAGGTGKTTGEMEKAKTFLDAGWDFVGETANGTADIWWILEGKNYPRLWWEAHN